MLRETTTATFSSAAAKPAGAKATKDYQEHTWRSRRGRRGRRSTGGGEACRQWRRRRGESDLGQISETASSGKVPHLLLMLPEEGIEGRSTHRRWRRRGVLTTAKGEIRNSAATWRGKPIGVRCLLQEGRGRKGNREGSKGATGAPVPPTSFTGENGGEVQWLFGAPARRVGAS